MQIHGRAALTRLVTTAGPGKEPLLYVGNLEAVRNLMDVRDVVHAYWLATEKCTPEEVYNIASGHGRRIRDVLDQLLQLSRHRDIRVEQDPQRMRVSDVPILAADSTKFRQQTSWEAQIPFERTLEGSLDYWRSRI